MCHDTKDQFPELTEDIEAQDCEKFMKRSDMPSVMMVSLVLSLMPSAYFAYILGLHWMNSDKPERSGGVPKPQQSVQPTHPFNSEMQ